MHGNGQRRCHRATGPHAWAKQLPFCPFDGNPTHPPLPVVPPGDEVVVVDANFPAVSTAEHTVVGSPVALAGANVVDALDAICSLLPLDFFVS